MNFNCVIIDDEPQSINIISRYINESPSLRLIDSFRNPVDAIDFLAKTEVHIAFVDINMPQLSGIDMVKLLPDRIVVIFITAYQQYAIESYKLNVIDYLLKPFSFDRFLQAVKKAEKIIYNGKVTAGNAGNPANDTIFLKSGKKIYQVSFNDILFIEKKMNYLSFQLSKTEILIRSNMDRIFEYVPAQQFIRVHKSFVVNIPHIAIIETDEILINDFRIPISDTYRKSVLKKLTGKGLF